MNCIYRSESEEWQNSYTVQGDEILQLNYQRTSSYAFSEEELAKMSELYNSLPGVKYSYQEKGDTFIDSLQIDLRQASLNDLHLYGFIETAPDSTYVSSLQTIGNWRQAGFECAAEGLSSK